MAFMNDSIIYAKATCYNLANDAGWESKGLKTILQRKNYRFVVKEDEIVEKIFITALYFAKYTDYVDLIVSRMKRKNGDEYANNIFRQVFPQFNDVNELYRYCYDLCSKEGMDLKEEAKKLGMTVSLIRYYAKESKLGELHQDVKRYQKRIENIHNNHPKELEVIEFLLNHDNPNEIIEFLKNNDGKFDGTKIHIYSNVLYAEMSSEEIKKRILDKYHLYINYKRSILNASQERINASIKKINDFVNGPYINFKSFAIIHNTTKETLERSIHLVKVHDKELYLAFKEKVNNLKQKKYPESYTKLHNIALYIINGINHRPFTIVDYLSMTDYPVFDFYYIVANEFDEDSLMILRKFYNKYRDLHLLSLKMLARSHQEINCELDSSGFPIPGTGREITLYEKSELIKQINKDGYPLYEEVYDIYLKDFISNINSEQKQK